MRPIIAAALLLGLAACQPQAPDGAPAPPPADAPPVPAAQAPPPAPVPAALPPELAGDLDAKGTEPFWAVSIRKDAITLTRPDEAEVKAPATTAVVDGGKAVWTTKGGDKPLVVSLWKQDCSDGMSDRIYPLTAEVKLGDTVLKGCGAKAG